jgi:hypothetical protein
VANTSLASTEFLAATNYYREEETTLTNEQLQKVVDAENKRLNEESEAVALSKIRNLRSLIESRDNLNKRIDEVQKSIVELPFDSVTLEDVVNGHAPKA